MNRWKMRGVGYDWNGMGVGFGGMDFWIG